MDVDRGVFHVEGILLLSSDSELERKAVKVNEKSSLWAGLIDEGAVL